ncbi:MAG: homoserine kinase [Campylobacterales bacterium]
MTISVPATSANMGPGFDTLGVALGLYNEITIRPSKFTSVSIKGEGKQILKLKGGNIFVRIFNEYYKNLTGKIDSFKFEFINRIPLSRGLGSSSAVIVSAIAAAYEAAGVHVSHERILSLALNYEPHPDNISPAVNGGFNIAAVDRDQVVFVKHDMPEEVRAVVVIPDKAVSTHQSRTTLPRKLTLEDAVFNLSRSSLLTASIMTGKWENLRLASQDRIHQEIRMSKTPELFKVQAIALENGALMSTLSGSGSTFFSMVYRDDAKRVAAALQEAFPAFRVEDLPFDNVGLVVRTDS